MVLIFSEDAGLIVAEDLRDVQRHCEGIDVESGVFKFYDEDGQPLKPVFDVPVRRRRVLWFIWSIESGRYHLEADPTLREDPIWVALHETQYLRPNGRFASLDDVKSFLRGRGVAVDRPDRTSPQIER